MARLTKGMRGAIEAALDAALAGDFEGGDFHGMKPEDFEKAQAWIDAMEPAVDLSKLMRAIAKASGGGRVTVDFPEGSGSNEFYARVYPTWEQARDLVRQECGEAGRGYPGDGYCGLAGIPLETIPR